MFINTFQPFGSGFKGRLNASAGCSKLLEEHVVFWPNINANLEMPNGINGHIKGFGDKHRTYLEQLTQFLCSFYQKIDK